MFLRRVLSNRNVEEERIWNVFGCREKFENKYRGIKWDVFLAPAVTQGNVR